MMPACLPACLSETGSRNRGEFGRERRCLSFYVLRWNTHNLSLPWIRIGAMAMAMVLRIWTYNPMIQRAQRASQQALD